MKFWRLVFELGFGSDFIRKAVKTDSNPFGEITMDEFKEITGEDFIKVVKPAETPTSSETQNNTQTVVTAPVINPASVVTQPTTTV